MRVLALTDDAFEADLGRVVVEHRSIAIEAVAVLDR